MTYGSESECVTQYIMLHASLYLRTRHIIINIIINCNKTCIMNVRLFHVQITSSESLANFQSLCASADEREDDLSNHNNVTFRIGSRFISDNVDGATVKSAQSSGSVNDEEVCLRRTAHCQIA